MFRKSSHLGNELKTREQTLGFFLPWPERMYLQEDLLGTKDGTSNVHLYSSDLPPRSGATRDVMAPELQEDGVGTITGNVY